MYVMCTYVHHYTTTPKHPYSSLYFTFLNLSSSSHLTSLHFHLHTSHRLTFIATSSPSPHITSSSSSHLTSLHLHTSHHFIFIFTPHIITTDYAPPSPKERESSMLYLKDTTYDDTVSHHHTPYNHHHLHIHSHTSLLTHSL